MPASKNMKLAMIGTVAAALIALPLGAYLRSGDKTLETNRSPDGRYGLEVRSATRWQVITHSIADQLVYTERHT